MTSRLTAILLAGFLAACANGQELDGTSAQGRQAAETDSDQAHSKRSSYWTAPGRRYPRRDD
jgi:hypothetical protein